MFKWHLKTYLMWLLLNLTFFPLTNLMVCFYLCYLYCNCIVHLSWFYWVAFLSHQKIALQISIIERIIFFYCSHVNSHYWGYRIEMCVCVCNTWMYYIDSVSCALKWHVQCCDWFSLGTEHQNTKKQFFNFFPLSKEISVFKLCYTKMYTS